MAGVSPRTMARWQSMKIAVPPSSRTVTTATTKTNCCAASCTPTLACSSTSEATMFIAIRTNQVTADRTRICAA